MLQAAAKAAPVGDHSAQKGLSRSEVASKGPWIPQSPLRYVGGLTVKMWFMLGSRKMAMYFEESSRTRA